MLEALGFFLGVRGDAARIWKTWPRWGISDQPMRAFLDFSWIWRSRID
jgi:hypothetical protein